MNFIEIQKHLKMHVIALSGILAEVSMSRTGIKEKKQTGAWEKEIAALEEFFSKKTDFDDQSIYLNSCSRI
jgi:hypothetical protein